VCVCVCVCVCHTQKANPWYFSCITGLITTCNAAIHRMPPLPPPPEGRDGAVSMGSKTSPPSPSPAVNEADGLLLHHYVPGSRPSLVRVPAVVDGRRCLVRGEGEEGGERAGSRRPACFSSRTPQLPTTTIPCVRAGVPQRGGEEGGPRVLRR